MFFPKALLERFIKTVFYGFCCNEIGFQVNMEKVKYWIRQWGSLFGCLGVIFLVVFLLADSSEKTPVRFTSVSFAPSSFFNVLGQMEHYIT
jgi:hypothetical protein